MIFHDNSFSIGGTPMVRLRRVTANCGATVLAKLEGRNPANSVKCRIGAAMVWEAEEAGLLRPGMELVEPTSGNTGIALACVAAARGYPLTLTAPETISAERRMILQAFGTNLVVTPGEEGMLGAVRMAEHIHASEPDRYLLLQQFRNPANPRIHFRTTGPEIWNDTGGEIDALVAGVGTGGTISGVSRYLKQVRRKPVLSVAVEPAASPVVSQALRGDPIEPGPHRIQGIGPGFVPEVLDLNVIDRVEAVTDEEALEMMWRLAREEGILGGVSCGAAVAAAVRLAQSPEMDGRVIAVILPDSGERYLSRFAHAS